MRSYGVGSLTLHAARDALQDQVRELKAQLADRKEQLALDRTKRDWQWTDLLMRDHIYLWVMVILAFWLGMVTQAVYQGLTDDPGRLHQSQPCHTAYLA